MPGHRLAKSLGQLARVPCIHQRRRRDAEHRARALHRAFPVARVRQCLLAQLEPVVELVDGGVRRPSVEGEAQPLLQRIGQDHQILHLAVEAATLRRLDPGPQIPHGQRLAAVLRAFAIELVVPAPAELEVGLAHLAQIERRHDVPHLVAGPPLHLHPPLGLRRRAFHHLPHAAQDRAPDLDPELGMVREGRRERLGEDVPQRLPEARRHRRP